MKTILQLTIIILCLMSSYTTKAKHIIGGEITYVCNSTGNYTFYMDIYRDCTDPTGAGFDPLAAITIYRQNGSLYTEIPRELVPVIDSVWVTPTINPCMEPVPTCVKKARYQFTVSLPVIASSYHIVYQRCCRNATITNLDLPLTQGATYSIELTPEAQNVCNSSPTYDEFPELVICARQDIDFDHSATDPDGDQLIYSFCSPLLGGGQGGTNGNNGDAFACDGVIPTPSCPPPFDNVDYVFPTYSPTDPMGGDPIVSIDQFSGLISGIPIVQGQFVVGVCVEEYRNGVLLSRVRRDFQYNVTSCTPLVNASIDADDVINGQDFVVNACGNSTVTFDNLSVQQSNIVDFFWEFDIDGDGIGERFTEWDATVPFPGDGQYEGVLVLNPGLECNDTANIFVNVYPGLEADFTFSYDTCVSGPVSFTDLSIAESGTITDWFWDFGEQNTSVEQHPEHLYMVPGDHPVTLSVIDINGCEDEITKIINYYPAPAVVIVEPSTFIGCAPGDIFFNNLSFPIDSTYDILWDFGDGGTSTEISPTHTYEEVGVYDVSLEITSPLGCFAKESWDTWIRILPAPIADFTFSPRELNIFENVANFVDASTDAVGWNWNFDNDGFSNEQNPSFAFPDTGLQVVTLIVTHESGCQDSLTQFIDVRPVVRYFLPNAFTPNFDDINDFFLGNGIFDGMSGFQMTIWNRYGELIFETNNPTEGWNGKKRNVGKDSPMGVYVYQVTFSGPRGEPFNYKGYATLIR